MCMGKHQHALHHEILHFITYHSYAWLACIVVLIADQITKNLILVKMTAQESIPVVQGIFHLTYVQNTGIAFSLFQNTNTLFIVISFAIIGVLLAFLSHLKENQRLEQVCLGLVLGGALGNLIDRVFLGFVVDFLDFRIWPVFNAADSAITIGVLGLLILLWNK